MKKFDLNLIPIMIRDQKLTKEEAVKRLALFIQENHKVFLIQDTEIDLKSEVILRVLEKGLHVLEKYDSAYGSFFNFFYCFVQSSIHCIKRRNIEHALTEYHNITEEIQNYAQIQTSYSTINYSQFQKPKIPYRYKPIDAEAFQIACKSDKYSIKEYISNHQEQNNPIKTKITRYAPYKTKKILLVLALKSAYYIKDEEIKIICEICGIEYNILLDVIQSLKAELIQREENKRKLESRRNKAYFHHKKYSNLIFYLKDDDDADSKIKLERLEYRYSYHTKSWNSINQRMKKGVINIRPTNKTVAEILGICERQVSYYIKNVEELNCIN